APVRTHRAAARGTRGLVVPSGGGVDGGPGWRGHGPALGGSAAVAGQLDLQLRRAEACGRPPGVQSVGARRGQLLLETAGFLFWGFTGELVCFLAGLVYPMWASFRVLEDFHEDPAGGAPEEWLAYWVSHTALTLLECVLRRFLELIPFYYPLRRRLLGLDGARAQEGGGGAPHQDCWPGRGPGRAAPLLRADAGRHAPAQAVLCTAGQPGGTLRPRPRGVRLLAASRHSACLPPRRPSSSTRASSHAPLHALAPHPFRQAAETRLAPSAMAGCGPPASSHVLHFNSAPARTKFAESVAESAA
ncbi:unnamed protein product, partial [Prorocentrum cordatum]